MKCPNCDNEIKRFRNFNLKDLAEYKCDSCGVVSEREKNSLFFLSFLNAFIFISIYENYKYLGLYISIIIVLLWIPISLYLDNKFGKLEDVSRKRYPINELLEKLRNQNE